MDDDGNQNKYICPYEQVFDKHDDLEYQLEVVYGEQRETEEYWNFNFHWERDITMLVVERI